MSNILIGICRWHQHESNQDPFFSNIILVPKMMCLTGPGYNSRSYDILTIGGTWNPNFISMITKSHFLFIRQENNMKDIMLFLHFLLQFISKKRPDYFFFPVFLWKWQVDQELKLKSCLLFLVEIWIQDRVSETPAKMIVSFKTNLFLAHAQPTYQAGY